MKAHTKNIILVFLFLPSVLFAQTEQPKMRKNEIKVALLSLASGTSKVTYDLTNNRMAANT